MGTWQDYGLAGLVAAAAFALLFRVFGRGFELLKVIRSAPLPASGGHQPPLLCQVDPLHFEHIRETHRMVSALTDDVRRGHLACVWDGRDEARDVLEALRISAGHQAAAAKAQDELTKEVRSLADAIRDSTRRR